MLHGTFFFADENRNMGGRSGRRKPERRHGGGEGTRDACTRDVKAPTKRGWIQGPKVSGFIAQIAFAPRSRLRPSSPYARVCVCAFLPYPGVVWFATCTIREPDSVRRAASTHARRRVALSPSHRPPRRTASPNRETRRRVVRSAIAAEAFRPPSPCGRGTRESRSPSLFAAIAVACVAFFDVSLSSTFRFVLRLVRFVATWKGWTATIPSWTSSKG